MHFIEGKNMGNIKKPLVSICIPTYNQIIYLQRTIESVISQSFRDFEVIISDDSTNDCVKKLIDSYNFNGKLRYFKNKTPLGPPGNWNNAIDKAEGEFIKMIHHDDWFTTAESLYGFVEAINKDKDAGFIFCSTQTGNMSGEITSVRIQSNKMINKIKKDGEVLLSGNIIGAPSVTFFRKTALRFDTNLKWLIDVDFYIQLLRLNPNSVFLKTPLIHVTSGAAHQVTNQCLNKEIEISEWFYVYDKYKKNKRFSLVEKSYLVKLFYKYSISSFAEIEKIVPKIPNANSVRFVIKITKVLAPFLKNKAILRMVKKFINLFNHG